MALASSRPPNLLWIMTDQQRGDALSCHGGAARTPVLDALAATGADLREHFAQFPVCLPSRCTLFPGRRPQAQLRRENGPRLAPHEPHPPMILRPAGYHLGYFGKNHLLTSAQMAAPNPDRVNLGEGAGTHGSQRAEHEFAPRRFAPLHPENAIALPDFAPESHVHRHPSFAPKSRAQGANRTTAAAKRRYLACDYAMCIFVAEQIGRLLAALQTRPDAADTIVLFTANHGDFPWRHGLLNNDLILCDELLRVPCIIAWPGRIVPRSLAGTFTEHAALVPTLLDLMGLAAPSRGPQSRSFAPLLRGETDGHRHNTSSTVCYPHQRNPHPTHAAFIADWEKPSGQPGHLLSYTALYNVPGAFTCSLRTRDWRCVRYADGFEELFDHRHDPCEWRNLAATPGHATTVTEIPRPRFEHHLRLEGPGSPWTMLACSTPASSGAIEPALAACDTPPQRILGAIDRPAPPATAAPSPHRNMPTTP